MDKNSIKNLDYTTLNMISFSRPKLSSKFILDVFLPGLTEKLENQLTNQKVNAITPKHLSEISRVAANTCYNLHIQGRKEEKSRLR